MCLCLLSKVYHDSQKTICSNFNLIPTSKMTGEFSYLNLIFSPVNMDDDVYPIEVFDTN